MPPVNELVGTLSALPDDRLRRARASGADAINVLLTWFVELKRDLRTKAVMENDEHTATGNLGAVTG